MTSKNSGEVFLIDASGFIFRAYYALAPLSSKGRPSHAVAGFASMLLKLLREKKPKSCVVVFDSKKPSFRKEIYPEYKAHREVPPPDLSGQIVAVMQMVKAAALPVLQEEGMEADDWIASFACNAFADEKVIIVSSDKDLAQLVNSRVKMYDSMRDKLSGPKQIEEKFGVKPSQIGDYLALIGDASDNIPGIPGIGPKTATKLLLEYKNIEGIYKNLEALPAKQSQKFEEHREAVKLSRQLVALKEDLEIPFKNLPELKNPFPPAFRDFLQDWELYRLMKQFPEETGIDSSEMKSLGTKPKSENSTASLKLVENSKQLEDLKSKLKKSKSFSFDTETSSFNREEAKVVGASFCCNPKEAFYLPWRHGKVSLSEKEMANFLKEILEDETLHKCAHHAKYDLQVLAKEGIQVKGLKHDTMVSGHLLHADRRSVSLDNLAKDFLGEEKGDLKGLLKGEEDFSTIELKDAVPYAAKDALLTQKLNEIFLRKLKDDEESYWIYENIEIPLISVLAEMESAGVRLHRAKLEQLSKEMTERCSHIEREIYRAAGHEFNINSPKQLQVVLFEELGLTATKKTKTGYSTNEAVLLELQLEHEVPHLILQYRGLAKLISTYVDVLPGLIAKDGRVHTSYHQTGTATGRLSSSDPNLQNIPARSEEGRKIREAFIPADGFSFLSADYSQVELRLMAELSGDPTMIKAFQDGRDIHSETAKIIFGSEEKEFRSKAKAINFGIIYGISAFGLSQQLGIKRGEAKKFIDSYFEQFPKVKEYMESCVELAKKNQYTKTLFGRRRPLPDIVSKNPMLRQNAERIAMNAPLQGTAADIMKWAMVRAHQSLIEHNLKSRILLQVHDELVLELAKGEEEQVRALVKSGMMNLKGTPAEKMKVPLEVDTSIGDNWAVL